MKDSRSPRLVGTALAAPLIPAVAAGMYPYAHPAVPNTGNTPADIDDGQSREKTGESDLPIELILAIAKVVDDRKALASLSLTSRRWNKVVEPYLFSRVTALVVPRQIHLRSTSLEDSRLRFSRDRIQLLSAFQSFLEDSPTHGAHVKGLELFVVGPGPPSQRNGDSMDESYAIAPETLLSILRRIPNLKMLVLTNVFLSRPLHVAERNSVTTVIDICFNFSGPWYRRNFSADLLEVTDIFGGSSVRTITLHSLADGVNVPENQLYNLKSKRKDPLQVRKLEIMNAENPQTALIYLLPSMLTLEVLILHYLSAWARQAMRDILAPKNCWPRLRLLQLTFLICPSDRLQANSFAFLSGSALPNLHKLALGFRFSDPSAGDKIWHCINCVLQTLTPAKYSVLRSVVVFAEQVTHTLKPPTFLPPQFFDASDAAMLRLAEEGRLEQLVFGRVNLWTKAWCNLEMGNYGIILRLFPRAHAKGLLCVPETLVDVDAILRRHGLGANRLRVGRVVSDPEERRSS